MSPYSHFLKYLLWVPLFTVFLMAHLSSNQYGQSFFLLSKLFFAIIQDQMKDMIEAWSRFIHGKLQTGHAGFCRDRNGDFTDSCITWLSARCLARLLFATFLFYPFAHLNTVLLFAYISLSRQLHFQVCHTARSKGREGFQSSFWRRIYIWGAWSSSLVASINGTAHKRIILRVSSIFLALFPRRSVYVIIS